MLKFYFTVVVRCGCVACYRKLCWCPAYRVTRPPPTPTARFPRSIYRHYTSRISIQSLICAFWRSQNMGPLFTRQLKSTLKLPPAKWNWSICRRPHHRVPQQCQSRQHRTLCSGPRDVCPRNHEGEDARSTEESYRECQEVWLRIDRSSTCARGVVHESLIALYIFINSFVLLVDSNVYSDVPYACPCR